jgi:hypothetical protein
MAGAGSDAVPPAAPPGATAGVDAQEPSSPAAAGSDAPDPSPGAIDPMTPPAAVPDDCKGFELVGLTHSPGGDVLPNTCAPFHGTYNNPYAIRCVDADPSYHTPWKGDEYCILPPEPDKGTQLYIGPSSYDDAADYAPFLLEPGVEVNTSYYVNADNEEPRYYYRTNWRMRDGSHHMLIYLLDADRADGWADSADAGTDLGMIGRSFGGTQRTDADRPQGTLEIPPENQGLGAEMATRQQFSFNLHHMNRFDQPILREAWVNVWYLDEPPTEPMQTLAIYGNPLDLMIPNGERRTLHYKATATDELRIITIWAHRHASTDRFGVWLERASGETLGVYESFDYEDMPTYQYDSVSQNPIANVETRADGAYSGILEIEAGDELHFVCDVNNQSGVTLRFANELKTGEMCIVFGARTGAGNFGSAVRVMD